MKIALATRDLGCPLKKSLQIAASLAARGVQFEVIRELKPGDLTATGRRQLLHLLGELGLSVASLTLCAPGAYHDETGLDTRVSATLTAIEFARQLRTEVLEVCLGTLPTDKESKSYRVLFEVLGDLARHGNRCGVILALTPSGDSLLALQELISSISSGRLGIDFDPGAFALAGNDPAAVLRALCPWVVDIAAGEGSPAHPGAGLAEPLHRSAVRWPELFAVLKEFGYQGWVTVQRMQGMDRAGAAARAITFLNELQSATGRQQEIRS